MGWLFVALIAALGPDQAISLFLSQEKFERFRLLNREITDIGLASHWWIFGFVIFFLCLADQRGFFKSLFGLRKKETSGPPIREISRFSLSESFSEFSLRLLFGLGVAGLTNQILKMSIGRLRPLKSPGFSNLHFEPFTLNWDFHSLPSGHTQVLFTVATVFAWKWPGRSLIWFFLAAVLSFTRIGTLYHFLSDVIVGAVVGNTCTSLAGFYLAAPLGRRIFQRSTKLVED